MAKGMINCDFKQLQKYFDKFSKLNQNQTKELIKSAMNRLAGEVLRKVTEKTPVDTGNLKRSWYVTDVQKQGRDYVVFVGSDLDYAKYVEYGHRVGEAGWVNGCFMLTLSVDEVENKTPKLIETVIKNKLEQIFGGDSN